MNGNKYQGVTGAWCADKLIYYVHLMEDCFKFKLIHPIALRNYEKNKELSVQIEKR